MPSSWNLFRSDTGIELVPEICLLIIEQVIDDEPKVVRSLLLISKSFHSLLKKYERSITKRLSYNDKRLAYTNTEQLTVLASRLPPRDTPVGSLSYSWLFEMRYRSTTIEFLVGHDITQMEDYTSDWPTLDIPKSELEQRLTIFKRKAFLLLYRLADCAVGFYGTKNIRARQNVFLNNISLLELATLGVMVEVIGQGYFTMTKKALVSSGLRHNDVLLASISPSSYFYTPSSIPINELMSDNWVRECMCVFEDLTQRHGPYFALAYLTGSEDRTRRPDLWARSELQQGLDDMNAFELGYTMSFASLQSVVWRIFCKKANCSLQDSWTPAKKMIESEMAAYEIED